MKKNQDFSTLIWETSENVYLFVSISWLVPLKLIFIYSISLMYKWLFEVIKRRSKVQEKNRSCDRALNFNQWKTFSENYKPMRVWLWLVYKFTENHCRLRLFSEFIQTQEVSYLSRQSKYSNLKTTCHIKAKFSLWTKLLKNLLLAKYLISVAAALSPAYQSDRKWDNFGSVLCDRWR